MLACCSYWTKGRAVLSAARLKSVQTNIREHTKPKNFHAEGTRAERYRYTPEYHSSWRWRQKLCRFRHCFCNACILEFRCTRKYFKTWHSDGDYDFCLWCVSKPNEHKQSQTNLTRGITIREMETIRQLRSFGGKKIIIPPPKKRIPGCISLAGLTILRFYPLLHRFGSILKGEQYSSQWTQ